MKEILVALIRGINVGKAKRVAMADLKSLFEELGFEDVRTVLNSGNVIFTSEKNEAETANLIAKELVIRTGVSAKVTVLTAKDIEWIINNNPFDKTASDFSRLIVAVLLNKEDKEKILPLEKQSWEPELFSIGQSFAYMWCPNGVLESKLSASVNRVLGDNVTSRNMSTLLKIHAIISKIEGI